MCSFYLHYPERRRPAVSGISQTVSGKSQTWSTRRQNWANAFPLSWSHCVCLLGVSDANQRAFYENEAVRARWSRRQLERHIDSMEFERNGLPGEQIRSPPGAQERLARVDPEQTIKDPYVLEFLGMELPHSERELESALIGHMSDFLLELGCGFTFVARQKRLQIGTESYHLDLLLYHRGLRCLVAIDLKVGKFTAADAGQMNLYLNYLKEEETAPGETPPIGLILCAEKNETVARYALGGLTNRVFASRYRLQLPETDVLTREVEAERRRLNVSSARDRPLRPRGIPSTAVGMRRSGRKRAPRPS